MTLRQAIVFSILMENGSGILDKSSSYIRKKLQQSISIERPEFFLDKSNLVKFKRWQEIWKEDFTLTDDLIKENNLKSNKQLKKEDKE